VAEYMATQWLCVDCSAPVARRVRRCSECNKANLPLRGTYVRTDEHRAKMSAGQKGRRHSWRSGSTRPEIGAKIAQAWTPEMREAARIRGNAQATDRAWRDLIARLVSGELNPNHQGKGRATPYAPGWGRLHKRLIRERDDYRCQNCGKQPKLLHIHHKDWSKANHHPDNLISLCPRCHFAVHPRLGPVVVRDTSGRFC
jgi:hypothetical protein